MSGSIIHQPTSASIKSVPIKDDDATAALYGFGDGAPTPREEEKKPMVAPPKEDEEDSNNFEQPAVSTFSVPLFLHFEFENDKIRDFSWTILLQPISGCFSNESVAAVFIRQHTLPHPAIAQSIQPCIDCSLPKKRLVQSTSGD
eukprot:scaffold7345_cov78-Cylindrotheca_fusiformis.AAC.2